MTSQLLYWEMSGILLQRQHNTLAATLPRCIPLSFAPQSSVIVLLLSIKISFPPWRVVAGKMKNSVFSTVTSHLFVKFKFPMMPGHRWAAGLAAPAHCFCSCGVVSQLSFLDPSLIPFLYSTRAKLLCILIIFYTLCGINTPLEYVLYICHHAVCAHK